MHLRATWPSLPGKGKIVALALGGGTAVNLVHSPPVFEIGELYTVYMGGRWSGSSAARPETEETKQATPDMALSKAKDLVSSHSVLVFSKTYCGDCARVKQLLTQLGANYTVFELNIESDGAEIQSALAEWTGQRTVPNVFIGGKHIGGCDNVMAVHASEKLASLLTEAGALSVTST